MIKRIRLNKKKGFTLIELIVVIAIVAILVLLALPRFIGQTEKAREANIVHDIKVSEIKVQEYLLGHDDFGPDWGQVDMAHMNGLKETGVLYSREGLVDPADTIMEGSYHTLPTDFVKTEVNSKLKGSFYTNKGGNVYYEDTKPRKQEKPEAETPIDMPIPDYYELATDSDFIWVDTSNNDKWNWFYIIADQLRAEEYGSVDAYYEYLSTTLRKEMEEAGYSSDDIYAAQQANNESFVDRAKVIVEEMEFGYFYYVGEADYVIIPDTIQGKTVERTFKMFGEGYTAGYANYYTSRVKGVASNNPAITDMSNMFYRSDAETLELLYLNTINVTNMEGMFRSTDATNITFGNGFNTSNVTNMANMFESSSFESIPLPETFDTANVTTMENMFYDTEASAINLTPLDTSNVTNMGSMFQFSQAPTLDLSNFNTANVTDMSWMFRGSKATSLDLSSFDTSNVTDMSRMFWESQATTLDLSSFNTANVVYMSSMFEGSQATTLDLSSFDTSNVVYMNAMFQFSQATTLDLSSFDTSNVGDMGSMFRGSQAPTLDLSNFNTANVVNMRYMFEDSQATTLDLSSFDLRNIVMGTTNNASTNWNMFNGAAARTGYARTTEDRDKLNNTYTYRPRGLKFVVKPSNQENPEAETPNEHAIPDYYELATDSDFKWDASNRLRYIGDDEYVIVPHVVQGRPVTSYEYTFDKTYVKGVASDNPNITSMMAMFSRTYSESLDLRWLDTSSVTNMSNMFNLSRATSLDLSRFDTSNVTDMRWMFQHNYATALDLSSFDTSNVTGMSYMFNFSEATELDISSFDTSNVTNMSSMFESSSATSLDLSNFDTSNVTNMSKMFYTVKTAATVIDASSFDTSNVTDMSSMFGLGRDDIIGASVIDVSGFNTSKVIDMDSMFYLSNATVLDLSSFDMSNVVYTRYMFYQAKTTTGYARTTSDATKLNGSRNKPSTLKFVVKP